MIIAKEYKKAATNIHIRGCVKSVHDKDELIN